MMTPDDFKDMIAHNGTREIIVTPKMIEEVKRLSGLGLKRTDIAAYFGIAYSTLKKKATENLDLRIAFRQGKAEQTAEVAGELIQQIRDGNTTATVFYLKTQAGWKEPDNVVNQEEEDEDEKAPPENLELNTKDPIEAAKAYQQFMLRGKK